MRQVLILGNGESRKELTAEIQNWKDEVWACNGAYQEIEEFPSLSRLCSVHSGHVQDAIEFRNTHGYVFQIVGKPNFKGVDRSFNLNRGWSTGSLALYDALYEGYDVVLAGFDFGGRDVYQPGDIVGSNFVKQFIQVIKKWGMDRIRFLNEGGITKSVREHLLHRYENSFKRDETLYRFLLTQGLDVGKEKPEKRNEDQYSKKFVPSKLVQMANEKRIDQIRNLPPYRLPKGVENVLIIGNSPSVLDHELGSSIDNDYDLVVRINDYLIDGYEKSIGSRIDVWFNGANKDFVNSKGRGAPDCPIVLGLLIVFLNHLDAPERFFSLRDKVRDSLGIDVSTESRVSIMTMEEATRIKKTTGLSNPSTGLRAIAYFYLIMKPKTLTIFGFDWYQNSKHHYYDDSSAKGFGNAHSWGQEKMWVDGLVKKGYIKSLD
jgi:hypothetical protein